MYAVILRRFDDPDELRTHDSWVIGEEPYVLLHRMGAADYAAHK